MADLDAYFAGFFDGEGSVAIYPKKYVVSLTNTDIRPLLSARDRWGGFISSQAASKGSGRVQDIFRWQIYGHSSRQFLTDIRPFTVTKGEQIDVYLDALDRVPVGRGKRYQPGDRVAIESSAARLRLLKRGA